jgi:hypothetical protein
LIDEQAKAKAMKMLALGHRPVAIERATGIKQVTVRSWSMKLTMGITSLTSLRETVRYDSGQMREMAEIGDGWDTAMGLDLLRYRFEDFHKYFIGDYE